MNEFDTANLVYLVLLLVVVGGAAFTGYRRNFSQTLKQASAWVLIFVAALLGYGLWMDITGGTAPRQSVIAQTGQITTERRFDGHFYLTLQMDGHPVEFVVDTGATDVVLSKADAEAIGINLAELDYIGSAYTANGKVRTAPALVSIVTLENVEDRNLRIWVNDGDMDGSLLGMAYLRKFTKIEISQDVLTLTR